MSLECPKGPRALVLLGHFLVIALGSSLQKPAQPTRLDFFFFKLQVSLTAKMAKEDMKNSKKANNRVPDAWSACNIICNAQLAERP